jgi:hypothetical protein
MFEDLPNMTIKEAALKFFRVALKESGLLLTFA